MKIKEGLEQAYADWKAKQEDDYGLRCFTYAEDWADMLEKIIPEEAASAYVMRIIVDNAEKLARKADTDGIAAFMYGIAVSVLAKCWIHGEELRRWHNLTTQLRDEGEKANEKEGTVLNPAMIVIK